MVALYIRISYGISPTEDDDPAGFIAISIVTTFISIVIATAAAVFESLFAKCRRAEVRKRLNCLVRQAHYK